MTVAKRISAAQRVAFVAACVASASAAVGGAVRLASASGRSGETVRGKLGAKLDQYLSRAAEYGFAGSVLVAKGDRVILAKGYGLADREGEHRCTADTVYDIGSITKQFTAAAILKLEMQGKLNVEDKISRFLPAEQPDKADITIHQLLTHSAGLPSVLGGDYEEASRDWIVRHALESELLWPPGTRYRYSNAGYSLLGAIVEIASGQPYERYLRENLFRPAGLEQTGYRLADWKPEQIAHGYVKGRDWGTPLDHPWDTDGPYWNLRANGGILSTLRDLYRWHRALEGNEVLSGDAKAKLFAPHVPEDEAGTSFYGYGWAIIPETGLTKTRLISHNGGNGVFYADFRRYVDAGVVILLATNVAADAPVREVENTVTRIALDKPYTLPPPVRAVF